MRYLPAVVLLVACTPQDAEVTADYAIFFGADSSDNIDRLNRTGIDVSERLTGLGLTPIDCRDLSGYEEEEIADLRLAGVDYGAECCTGGSGETCDALIEPKWFEWLDDYAFYLKEGKVEPWRTEAVITTEGDLQLTVHMDVEKFGDFRFGWVIDPNFAPQTCVDGDAGAELQPVDGDWLAGWSAGEESGTLWHLNGGAFQVNPSDNGVGWYFEPEWMAGYSFARFADEPVYAIPTAYNDEMYRPFFVNTYATECNDRDDNDDDGVADDDDPNCETSDFESGTSIPVPRGVDPDKVLGTWIEATNEYFATDVTDLATLGKSAFPLQMKIEDNTWRTVDDEASGLDNWLGVSQSWVRIDNPGDIKIHPDNPITGEFQIYLESVAASTKLIVGGTFSISEIREDVWGYELGTLEEVKREQNGTAECGSTASTAEE
jgi:hypothetical protein